MIAWLHNIKRILRPRSRWRVFRGVPRVYRERYRYALRCALRDEIILSMWVTSPTGTRFYLSQDPIDDAIARDIVTDGERLFPKRDSLGLSGGVILDVGGHHGLYAAEALSRYPGRKLVVVEPHPAWCELIRRNLAANRGQGRTRVVNACLASDHGRRTLRFDPNSSWGATVHANGDGLTSVEVQALTLPDILQVDPVAMIYCNAEGAEYALVPQLRQHNLRPAFMVLCVHPEYGDGVDLRRTVRDMGYTETDLSPTSTRPLFHYALVSSR